MNQQLSLFNDEATNERLTFFGSYRNDDWSTKTHTVDGNADIVDSIDFELTKSELKVICQKAVSADKYGSYGYEVFFEDVGVKKKIFVRFLNYTTKKKWSVFDYIDLYFDEAVGKIK